MYIPSSRSGVRIMQTGEKKACFRFPECSLSYDKDNARRAQQQGGKPLFYRT